MKKILIIMLSLGLAMGASAQHFVHGGGFYGGPRVVVGVGGYIPYYSPFYYPFGYPYYGYGYRPTKLQMQIQDIKNEYGDRIYSVKHDSSLSHKEKRHQIHMLKEERDRQIEQAKMNYYKNY